MFVYGFAALTLGFGPGQELIEAKERLVVARGSSWLYESPTENSPRSCRGFPYSALNDTVRSSPCPEIPGLAVTSNPSAWGLRMTLNTPVTASAPQTAAAPPVMISIR